MAKKASFSAKPNLIDLAILDLGLPRSMASSSRPGARTAKNMPVLILSARDRWSEKVEGLDLGANDYVNKPFHMAELLALRANCAARPITNLRCWKSAVRLNAATGQVTVNGTPVKLTAYQYKVLEYLMHHAGASSRAPN